MATLVVVPAGDRTMSFWINLQVKLLCRIAPPIPVVTKTVYDGKSKLQMLLGSSILQELRGLRVMDFGCGEGSELVELAASDVREAIGLDNRESVLEVAREQAARAGVQAKCRFVTAPPQEPVDVILSLDSFEHFADPEGVLREMYRALRPGGCVIASWGPPWYHPFGPHLLELPPWTHVFFSERAIVKWRSYMRDDGATVFSEIGGGMNKMTIGRFERLVKKSGFRVNQWKVAPIRPLKVLHNRLTREFTTSVVQCKLEKPEAA